MTAVAASPPASLPTSSHQGRYSHRRPLTCRWVLPAHVLLIPEPCGLHKIYWLHGNKFSVHRKIYRVHGRIFRVHAKSFFLYAGNYKH